MVQHEHPHFKRDKHFKRDNNERTDQGKTETQQDKCQTQ